LRSPDAIFKKAAVTAALKSGEFIRKSVGKVRKLSYKGRTNIVTDVDKSAEEIIVRHLSRLFPDHSVLSEEMRPKEGSSPYKWVIDPIDGTTNFAHAFPFFSVSVALEKNSVVMLGAVYDPMRRELFFAEKGGGAYLNNKRIRVSKTAKLSEGFLATGFAYDIERRDNINIRNFTKFLKKVMAIRRAGSAALDLCYVACGRFDGFWEMGLKPWDSAAGALLVREAGGKVTKFDGSSHSHYDEEILASNRYLHKAMVKVIAL
jgi:myo-inositol-1(or 4)-monophosphatase